MRYIDEILNNCLSNSVNRWYTANTTNTAYTTNTTNYYPDNYRRWMADYVDPRVTYNTTANDGWWARTVYNSHNPPEPEKFLDDDLNKILEVKPE